jgi:hypothetical protein
MTRKPRVIKAKVSITFSITKQVKLLINYTKVKKNSIYISKKK